VRLPAAADEPIRPRFVYADAYRKTRACRKAPVGQTIGRSFCQATQALRRPRVRIYCAPKHGGWTEMRTVLCSLVVVAVLATAATIAMAAPPGHHASATTPHHQGGPHIAGVVTAVNYAHKTKTLTSFVIRTWGKTPKTVTIEVNSKTRYVLVESTGTSAKKPKVAKVGASAVKVGLLAVDFFGSKDTHMTGPAIAVRLRQVAHQKAGATSVHHPA
jgi:hypothetical protein